MTAFRRAWSDGAQWLETDVQPTGDGTAVLIHDDVLDRTTDGTGPIRIHTAAQVAALDAGAWFGEEFIGARIPRLAELLAELAGDRRLLLEIKGEHAIRQVAVILAVIDAARAGRRVLLQSFEVPALRHVRALRPHEPVGLLVESIGADPAADCATLGAVTYNPDVAEVLRHPQLVDELHAAGVAIMPWTADRPDEWAELTTLGVDGIITNRPAELLAWQAGDASEPPATRPPTQPSTTPTPD